MITYVNTVLVGTGVGTIVSAAPAVADAGKYIVVDNDGTILSAATAAKAEAIKVGLVSSKTTLNQKTGAKMPIINWSNIIKKDDIKSYAFDTYAADTEDTSVVTFNAASLVAGKRIVVRLTFKDMPTRFRKWSESYEHVVEAGKATAADVVDAFVKLINVKGAKRARVIASNDTNKLKLVAMPYDDDDVVDSISPANKVRFTVNSWYTDPSAAGFASKNKYNAASIVKTPGKQYTASAKLVRDAEIQAMGYNGIINRGQGTWPIIKPAMNTKLDGHYDAITLEFENAYHTADDLQRKTKQTLQVFDITGKLTTATTGLKAVIEAFVKGENTSDNALAQGTKNTADANTKYSA